MNHDKKYGFETVLLLEKYLIYKEHQFGGFVDNVPRVKVSPYDPRNKEEILFGGNRGGDRMASLDNHHGYAAIYAKYLKPFLDNGLAINIAEVGILMGSGLALWCDLFPDSDVYGFDINLDYTKNNIPNLKNLGAFSTNEPLLYELDQFIDNTQYLQKIFGNKKINICIDDGFHSNETILKSFKSFLPFLAENFVYFIEDNAEVHKELMDEYPELDIEVDGEMTVIYRKAKENLEKKVSKPLSIMFISHSSDLNGAERSLFDLITKFVKRGVECAVILHSDGPLKKILNLNGVPVYVVPSSSSWWCQLAARNYSSYDDTYFFNIQENIRNDLLPLIQNIKPTLIYSQTIVKPVGAILAQMAGIPHIVAAREYGELDHGLNFRFGFQKSMKAIYEDSDLVFAVTNDVKNTVFGSNATKAIVVHSSIAIDETKLGNSHIAYKPIDKNNAIKLCMPAAILKSKGQLDAVLACKILVDKGYNIQLNLYSNEGESRYTQLIQTYINDHNLSDYIHLLPFSSNNLQLVYDADILLSCSVCEAFGRTMLEAALLKRPFVYANSGGGKEAFTDGVHALAYDSGNYEQLASKIEETIKEPLAVKKRVDTVYAYVKNNFNDNRYVDTQINAIENMLPSWKKRDKSACAELIAANIDYRYLADHYSKVTMAIQVFLSSDYNFCESNAFFHHAVGLEQNSCVTLKIPTNLANYHNIRIDLGDIPQMLSINHITVKDVNNQIVWEWLGNLSELYATNELQWINDKIIFCKGNDPYLIIPTIHSNNPLQTIEIALQILSLKEKAQIVTAKIDEANHCNAMILQAREEIKIKDDSICQLNDAIDYLNNQIIMIQSTRGYRALGLARKLINKLFPLGSVRRKLVKYLFYKPLKLAYKAVRFFVEQLRIFFEKYSIKKKAQTLNDEITIAFHHEAPFKYLELDFRKSQDTDKSLIFHSTGICTSQVKRKPFYSGCIYIITPIYNGYEYLEALFDDIYNNTDLPYKLIVVNDCSSDKRVSPFLANQQNIFDDKMILIDNTVNLGFIKSVNRGLALAKDHVVIVNTDVRLPKNWLSRLISPLIIDDTIASVTPFSNSATIFSLPLMVLDSKQQDLPENEVSLEDIDNILQSINVDAHKYFEFPTGVGFCMGMNKKTIDEIGFFDEIFAKGYCEENDWCMRAISKGYRNILVPNLFIYHKHGGSFASLEKKNLITSNHQILLNRHPSYDLKVRESLNSHYLKFHDYASILYYGAFKCKKILLVNCCEEDDSAFALLNSISAEKDKYMFFIFQFKPSNSSYKLTISYKRDVITFSMLDKKIMMEILSIVGFDAMEGKKLSSNDELSKIIPELLY